MDAIFGETTEPALFSAKTGRLITSTVERFLPAGKLISSQMRQINHLWLMVA
jgi:hypothetical protein